MAVAGFRTHSSGERMREMSGNLIVMMMAAISRRLLWCGKEVETSECVGLEAFGKFDSPGNADLGLIVGNVDD